MKSKKLKVLIYISGMLVLGVLALTILKNVKIGKGVIIDNLVFIEAMFPEKVFVKQGNYYKAGERENYYIESILPGSFVKKDNDELLVVVRRPEKELGHAEGFYNAYMAVFDNKRGKIVSDVKLFSVDEGNYRIFEGEGISYIFFSGNVTYQGWSNWYGGLWRAGSKWEMKWPTASEDDEYYAFWQNRAVNVDKNGIDVLIRKTLPKKNEGQTIPDYTWEFSERLNWDRESGSFKKVKL